MFGDIHRGIGRRGFRGGEPPLQQKICEEIKHKFGLILGTACRVLGEDLGAKSLREVKKTELSEKQKAEG